MATNALNYAQNLSEVDENDLIQLSQRDGWKCET